jgi:hypothetical protein
MDQELTLPMIGEDIREAKITKMLVKEGDYLDADQSFIEISTDKVDIELPSPVSGIVRKILVQEGTTVPSGAGLVLVSTRDSPDLAERKTRMSDIFTALKYTSALDVHHLCSRQDLGELTFEDYRDFLEDVGDIASRFTGLPFENIDAKVIDKLRSTLFFVTDLISNLQGFKPRDLGATKFKKHRKICALLDKDSGYALQLFRNVLSDVGREVEVEEYDETKAYVFISYSHSDAAHAKRLTRGLDRAHVSYFLDEKVSFGEDVPRRIHSEVARASHMVVLISPGSAKSAWVPYEMGMARAKGITIIPYVLHPDIPVPSFIETEKRLTTAADEGRLVSELSHFLRKPKPLVSEPAFERWRTSLAKDLIRGAKMIWHQSVSSYPSILNYSEELESFVHRGGQFHCLLTDPKGEALKTGAIRNVGASMNLEYLSSQFELTKKTLERIAGPDSKEGGVVLRTIDFLPDPILTIIDPADDEGVIFVTLNGFGQNPAARPSFLLRKQRDAIWFGFYRDSFQKLWGHPFCNETKF